MATVRLVDLDVFKRYSLAIRQESAPAEELLAVLDATRRQVEAAGQPAPRRQVEVAPRPAPRPEVEAAPEPAPRLGRRRREAPVEAPPPDTAPPPVDDEAWWPDEVSE